MKEYNKDENDDDLIIKKKPVLKTFKKGLTMDYSNKRIKEKEIDKDKIKEKERRKKNSN